jgi:pimeloyl-ACP methyl ester carboxylesterase
MKFLWIAGALIVLTVGATGAQPLDPSQGDSRDWAKAHAGAAPIDPPKTDEEHFFIDVASGLDTGCSYRDEGPLTFSIPIDRYIGEVDAQGFLKNPQLLLDNGVIEYKLRLLMPAYDVDSSATPTAPAQPEVDRITFNGHTLSKPLTGENDEWILNEFEIPFTWVKFPRRGASGNKPAAAMNEIRIDIDTANAGIGQQVWCTAIDWAQIQFKAMAPILLVHGINAGAESWRPAVTNFLSSHGIPFDENINLTTNGSVDGNAKELAGFVHDLAASFGAQKVHLLAHSKGGLDSRRFLSTYYKPGEVRVLSLFTLDTPHHGSVHADIGVARRTRDIAQVNDPDILTFINTDWLLAVVLPKRPGLDDLQTATAEMFNKKNPLPPGLKLYTFGADADVDNNGSISQAEETPLLPSADAWLHLDLGTTMYRILRDVSGITLTRSTFNLGHLTQWVDVSPIPTATPQLNDLSVTDASSRLAGEARHFGPFDRNHATIKDAGSLTQVLDRIRADFPVH